jgi:hypothetical protein
LILRGNFNMDFQCILLKSTFPPSHSISLPLLFPLSSLFSLLASSLFSLLASLFPLLLSSLLLLSSRFSSILAYPLFSLLASRFYSLVTLTFVTDNCIVICTLATPKVTFRAKTFACNANSLLSSPSLNYANSSPSLSHVSPLSYPLPPLPLPLVLLLIALLLIFPCPLLLLLLGLLNLTREVMVGE